VILWQHHGKTGVIPLLGTVLAVVGLWDVSLVLLSVIGHPLATTVLTGTLFLGVGFATMTFLVFTLVYTGREQFLTTPILAVLSAEPILLAVLAVVNPSHLFFESFNGTLEPGPLLWIHLVYAYLVLGLVTVLILGFLYRSRSLYKGQSAALLVGTLATWIANGVYVAGFVEFDTSPIGSSWPDRCTRSPSFATDWPTSSRSPAIASSIPSLTASSSSTRTTGSSISTPPRGTCSRAPTAP